MATLVFVVWFIGAVLSQIESPIARFLQRWDVLSLLPTWNFFAPVPLTRDFHLLYRCKIQGETSEWLAVPLMSNASWGRVLWNPGKRRFKFLADAANSLMLYKIKIGDQHLQLTLPYAALLAHTTSLAIQQHASEVQFLLSSVEGLQDREEAEVLYLSPFHPIALV